MNQNLLLPTLEKVGSGKKKLTASIISFWINTTLCFTGAGIFEIPHAFTDGGIVGSAVGMVVLAILSSYSLRRLAYCSDLMPDENLGILTAQSKPKFYEIGYCAIGRPGYLLSWFGLLAMTLGVCGSYIVFVASALAEVTGWNKTLLLLATICIIIPLSWMRRLNMVAVTSAFGIVALFTAVISVAIDAGSKDPPQNFSDLKSFDVEAYPMFLGNAGFCFLISTAVLPLHQNMDEESAPYFNGVFNSSIVFVTIMNLSFGVTCWYFYGTENVRGNVIMNLPDGPVKSVVLILSGIGQVFTCVVFLFPFNEALENEWVKPSKSEFSATSRTWKVNLLRTVVVCAVGFVAYLVPDFSALTGLSGGFGNNILGFILPPLFYWKLQKKRGYWDAADDLRSRIEKVFEQAVLLLIFVFGIGFLILSSSSFLRTLLD